MTKSVFTRKHDQFRRMLVRARKEAGLTQVELAKLLSRPQSFVSKFERGERRLDIVEFFEVAHAIGFEALEFLRVLKDGDGPLEGGARVENCARGKTHRTR